MKNSVLSFDSDLVKMSWDIYNSAFEPSDCPFCDGTEEWVIEECGAPVRLETYELKSCLPVELHVEDFLYVDPARNFEDS